MSAREAAPEPMPEPAPVDVAGLLDGPWIVVATKQRMHDGSTLPTYGIQANGLWIGRAHPLGPDPAEQALARRHAQLFAASKGMAAVLQEALAAFAPGFDADAELCCPDVVEWFAGWRERAKAALGQVGEP